MRLTLLFNHVTNIIHASRTNTCLNVTLSQDCDKGKQQLASHVSLVTSYRLNRVELTDANMCL